MFELCLTHRICISHVASTNELVFLKYALCALREIREKQRAEISRSSLAHISFEVSRIYCDTDKRLRNILALHESMYFYERSYNEHFAPSRSRQQRAERYARSMTKNEVDLKCFLLGKPVRY